MFRWRYFWQIPYESYFGRKKWDFHKTTINVFCGGRESLQVELNILGGSCGGCQYHSFPYNAQIPILVKGKKEVRTFTCKDDVWDAVDLLIEEVYEFNEKGKEFDVAQSINAQLPFFACRNILIDKTIQKDIQRYIYCNDCNVPPYDGSYGEQPALWVERYFLIKKALAKKENDMINKAKKESK